MSKGVSSIEVEQRSSYSSPGILSPSDDVTDDLFESKQKTTANGQHRAARVGDDEMTCAMKTSRDKVYTNIIRGLITFKTSRTTTLTASSLRLPLKILMESRDKGLT